MAEDDATSTSVPSQKPKLTAVDGKSSAWSMIFKSLGAVGVLVLVFAHVWAMLWILGADVNPIKIIDQTHCAFHSIDLVDSTLKLPDENRPTHALAEIYTGKVKFQGLPTLFEVDLFNVYLDMQPGLNVCRLHDDQGDTWLHHAVGVGRCDVVTKVLEHCPRLAYAFNLKGQLPIDIAHLHGAVCLRIEVGLRTDPREID